MTMRFEAPKTTLHTKYEGNNIEEPVLDILVQNIENGTFLSWNGGLSSIEEYIHNSDLEHRELDNQYVRLIIDRLSLFDPSNFKGVAGAMIDAKNLLENAGVIIAKPTLTELPEMHGIQRDAEQSELDSIKKEADNLRKILASNGVNDDQAEQIIEKNLMDFKPLVNEVTIRGLTNDEYRRLFCVLAKNIFLANKVSVEQQ